MCCTRYVIQVTLLFLTLTPALGSGFGQKENTWHFRSTFLPEEHLFDDFCSGLEKFHAQFIKGHQ